MSNDPQWQQQFFLGSNSGSIPPVPLILDAMTANKANMVGHLIDKAALVIESVWPSPHQPVSCGSMPVMPLHIFVKETLRRSRSTLSTLQLALYYIYRVRTPVHAVQERVRQQLKQRAQRTRLPPSPSMSSDGVSDPDYIQRDYFDLIKPVLSEKSLPPTPPDANSMPISLSPLSHTSSASNTPTVDSALQSGCGRRMFLAALILASKYQQDRTYSNKAWSKISGLPVSEINKNEIAFLKLIDYRLFVSQLVFQKWVIVLTERTIVGERPVLNRSSTASKITNLNAVIASHRRYAVRRHSAHFDNSSHGVSLPAQVACPSLNIPTSSFMSARPRSPVEVKEGPTRLQQGLGPYLTHQWVEAQRLELIRSQLSVSPAYPPASSRPGFRTGASVGSTVDPMWSSSEQQSSSALLETRTNDVGGIVLPSPSSSTSESNRLVTGSKRSADRDLEDTSRRGLKARRRLSVSFLLE